MSSSAIEFIAAYGDEQKVVCINPVFGGGGSCHHLLINKYYQGIITIREKWEVIFQNYNCDYTQADLDILIAMIEQKHS